MAKTWIVVADSARVRIFEAESHTGECTEIEGRVRPESRSRGRELGSDRPGRAFDSVGGARHAMRKHISPHEHEAELFARRIAERLSNGYNGGDFKHLQLAAPPAFLGVLRKCLDNNVRERLEKVINRNLVQESPDAIAAHFFGPRKGPKEPANR